MKLLLVLAVIIVFLRIYSIVNGWARETVRRRSKHVRVGW